MAYVLGTPTVQQYFDSSGIPLASGTIEFYLSGTSTPTPVYSDSSGTSLGTTVNLNADGAPESSGGTAVALYFDTSVTYKIIVKDSTGTQHGPTVDPFTVSGRSGAVDAVDSGASDSIYARTGTANGDQLEVSGYYTPGDGGGGLFWWDSASTDADDGGLTILPTGHVVAGRWKRMIAGIISPRMWGAKADGSDDSSAVSSAATHFLSFSAAHGQQYPDSDQPALYFDAGHYDCSAAPVTITTSNTGQVIYGDGITSQLEDVEITIEDNRCNVHNLLLRGSGTAHGIRVEGSTDNIRDGSVYNVWIRDKTDGVRLVGNNGGMAFTNVFSEKNTNGLRVDDTLGASFTNCYFQRNTSYGRYIIKAGELKFNNCTSSSNEDYGTYILAGSSSVVVECYFNQDTNTVNQITTTNRDTFSITAAADNGAGGTTLTIGSHTLTEGMQGSVISGTTDYNGEYDVFNVTDTTVDIAVAYTSSQTGTLTRPEWDLYMVSQGGDGNTNDLFFTGGNTNFPLHG